MDAEKHGPTLGPWSVFPETVTQAYGHAVEMCGARAAIQSATTIPTEE